MAGLQLANGGANCWWAKIGVELSSCPKGTQRVPHNTDSPGRLRDRSAIWKLDPGSTM